MTKITTVLVFLLSTASLHAATLNLADFGSVTQNTDIRTTIEAAMSFANRTPHTQDIIKFPAGTFYWGSGSAYTSTDAVPTAGFVPGNWIFEGAGRDYTIIKASASAADNRIFRCISCKNVTIRDLSFDHYGGAQFGGVLFYNSEKVTIERTRFFDSTMAGRPAQVANDINSYVFGRAGGHRDTIFRHNLIQDLQVDFSAMHNALIEHNTIERAWGTAALGVYSTLDVVSDQELIVLDKITIRNNYIVGLGSVTVGIAVHIDPAIQGSTPFKYQRYQRIKVLDNKIYHSTGSARTGYAIKFGQTDNSKQTIGFKWDDIEVARNEVYITSGTTLTGSGVIQFMTSRPSTPDFEFTNTRVYDNKLFAHTNFTTPFIEFVPSNNRQHPAWDGYSR